MADPVELEVLNRAFMNALDVIYETTPVDAGLVLLLSIGIVQRDGAVHLLPALVGDERYIPTMIKALRSAAEQLESGEFMGAKGQA